MNKLLNSLRPVSLLIGFTLAATPIHAEIGLAIEAPVALPRNTHLGAYSPAIQINYSGVPKGRNRVKLWLLETSTGGYNCASTQICERDFKVDNTPGTNSNGTILLAENFDVFDYAGFLWVARLYSQEGEEIASTRLEAKSVPQRAPVLHPVGVKSCVAGDELRFKVSGKAPGEPSLKYAARHLPPGAELNPHTGEFKWKPTYAGKVPGVVIEASVPATGLTDAEVIEIEIKAAK
jgi:hypothetical protein